jgi:hypothetical protein
VAVVATDTPMRSMQGIAVPAASVNPQLFFATTRRQTVVQTTRTYAGLGLSDVVQVLQTGILFGLVVRFTGTLTVTLGGGTAATTSRWPYGLIKNLRLNANGQSNLISCDGWNLKLRDIMARGDLSDRSVSRGMTGASPGTTITNGSLSLASESWGVNEAVTAIPGAPTNYTVDLEWYVPVAMDDVNLVGAVFAQTSSTDINLNIDYASSAELFTLTGAATAALTGTLVVEARLCSIPQGPDGGIVIPDLSTFHSIIQSRNSAVSNGVNELQLPGQGIGRQLMRVWHRTWSGSTPAPLAVNDTNYGQLGWRYGGNDTPELWTTAGMLRMFEERLFNSDVGVQGFVVHDFASENAFRDSVDEGAATALRVVFEHPAALSLTTPFVELTQETLFAGAAGA